MFQDKQILGVFVALIFICAFTATAIYFTRKLIQEQKIMFLFVMLTSLLAGVWCVDKIIAYKIDLLTEKESDSIFQVIIMIISFVIGSYKKENDNLKNN